ncbi:MAG: GNAT family N-acetyltransferase [Candidatus Jacksonbacteria bacterium]
MLIRSAQLKDCSAMSEMINAEAEKGKMLPRSRQEIMLNLPNFFVAEINDQIIACCGFKIWINEWIEIISLVTQKEYQRQGIGTKLVEACLTKVQDLGFRKISTVTIDPDWFSKRGFVRITMEELPHKIWGDCAKCPYNAADPGDVKCKEVPMVYSSN